MAEDANAAMLAELRGLRVDLRESTDRLVDELGSRIDANGRRIEENGRRIEENGRRIDATCQRLDALTERVEKIDGRLYVVESSMGWFREQVLAVSRGLTNAVLGRSRIEHDVDSLRESVQQLGVRVQALESSRE